MEDVAGWDALPFELQLKCLIHLGWKDIAMFSCVSQGCKQLADVIQRHGHVRSHYDDISPVDRAGSVLQRSLSRGAVGTAAAAAGKFITSLFASESFFLVSSAFLPLSPPHTHTYTQIRSTRGM